MGTLTYAIDRPISPAQFADVLRRTSLGPRRPVDDPERLAAMLTHGNLLVTAWDGDKLVGVARSLTDFAWCCYLSDLAVDEAYQRQGIGVELMRQTQTRLHPDAKIVLLAAPNARDYYPHVGLTSHPSAWYCGATDRLG